MATCSGGLRTLDQPLNTVQKSQVFRALGWLMVGAVVVLSLIRLPATPTALTGSDKLLHLLTYGFLSFWFFHTHNNKMWQVIAGFVLLGSVLEWLQSLTTYRFFEWWDWGMNLAGVMLAWVAFYRLKIKVKTMLN